MKFNIYLKIIFSFAISIFILLLSVKITLNLKSLYYSDIKRLNIESQTTLTNEEIKSTYSYLINYINDPKMVDFNIPTLQSSEEGKIHFLEVKNLFKKLSWIFSISIGISLFSIFFIYRNKDFSILNWSSNLLLSLCLFIWIPFYTNFNKSFNFFHKTFFRNNYWIFDPKNDPVINILPEKYFFHCAVLIISIVVIGALILKTLYIKSLKNGK
jgi:integral membrane protein (TIGR01906 family)